MALSGTPPASAGVDLGRMLATGAGVLAAAGGLIHLVVIRDHTDHRAVVAGFAVMAAAQFAFAFAAVTRPSTRLLLAGAGLHAAIAGIWVVSRTAGLGFVPGAEEAAETGVADVIAQVFSLGVIGAVGARAALGAAGASVLLPAVAAQRLGAVAAGGALLLAVPAVVTPHDHASHAGDDHGHAAMAAHTGAPEHEDSHPHPVEVAGVMVDGHAHGTPPGAPGGEHAEHAEQATAAATTAGHAGHDATTGHASGAHAEPAGSSTHGEHTEHAGDDHAAHMANCDETHPAVLDLKARVRDALEHSYPNVLALIARGYFPYYDAVVPYPTPETRVQHWLHPWYFNNGDNMNPEEPEGILLDEWFRPIGMMFISDIGVAGPAVYGEGETACRPWHPHDDDAARSFYAGYRIFWQGRTDVPEQTPEMMHVWLNNPYGTFSAHDYPPPDAREGFPPPTPWECTPGMASSPAGEICGEE